MLTSQPIACAFNQLARFLFVGLAIVAAGLASAPPAAAQTRNFVEFESGQVRPMAMTPDGTKLLAVNTPDNRLEVFSISGGSLTLLESVPVGMEPVAVAARNDDEVWVVNHLSDSVSVIDLSASPPRVVRTLLVGDEPRDIVFAGTGFNRAFITTAHRGQQRTDASISGVPGAGNPQLTTPGLGRADVWVFDALLQGDTLGGTPVQILTFFADTPRGLAVTPDGSTVYVAAFQSGNQTTTINETVVPNGFGPNGVPGPATNAAGFAAPETSVIVKLDETINKWVDSKNKDWSSLVKFNLPDHDVFSVNADTLVSGPVFDHVGTILFNLVVNPNPPYKVYVTNTELPNHINFEGPGVFGGSTVQGHLSESRISVLDPDNSTVDVQHLNPHIHYSQRHTNSGADHAAINAQKARSLATPLQPVVSGDGATLYVAAYGSAKIGVFNTADIENGNFDPTQASPNYIATSGGPSGMVLDEANNRLYVMTRFNNKIEVINLATKAVVQSRVLNNPEPAKVVTGRPFLYDANATSGNGEASCSSCHIFGDMDQLAWNLGNPDDVVTTNTQPQAVNIPAGNPNSFHPMKGPMTTQTLRGLATHGAMHWRGDRVDGFFGRDLCNLPAASGAPCSEDLSFRNFIVAFEGLVGKQGTITATEMQQFADFTLEIMLPPNPLRPLSNTPSGLVNPTLANSVSNPSALLGQNTFTGAAAPISDTVAKCDGCHSLNPALGFFGSGGRQSFEGETQNFKVPHMRNVYQKVGMFGLSTNGAGAPSTGDQIRGYGILHDGSVDRVFDFLGAGVFNLTETQRANLEAFTMEFPTDLAPIVGQQVTLTSTNGAAVNPRIDLMTARAGINYASFMMGGTVKECDLIVKGAIGGVARGAVREANGQFRTDKNELLTGTAVRALVNTEGPITYTCVPPGSGRRMGIDRDLDTVLDGLDNCPAKANTDQADGDGDGVGDVCDTAPGC